MAETQEESALESYKGDEQVVEVAKARFQRCQDWEGTAQQRWLNDIKFANADPDNGWQWPNYLWSQRRDDPNGYKPRLTVNKVHVHNLQIINDQKQNKPGIKISPVGDQATFDAAKIWMGLVRYIERVSKATQAYDTAFKHQVEAGLGYIRVETDYIDGTFDQELYIRRVKNPLNVYLDPDHNEIDGSDSRFGFVFDDVPRVEFLEENPEMKGRITEMGWGMTPAWVDQNHVRVVEYFTKLLTRDRLVLMKNPEPTGKEDELIIARWGKIPPKLRAMIDKNSIIKEREILDQKVMWYKIAADQIIERGEWPGRYIPLVPVIGEETVIENQLDRKGHTRWMKDAQRMYNFWTSNAVEQVALQTKSKWFVPVGATENLETYYRTINTQNYPYIPWNAFDSEGNQLPAPIPIEPPTMAEAYIQGMMMAQNELMMSSGQREENFGQPTNAISGRAIDARQRQGENATYGFIDGLAIAIRQVGNIILDTAPRIYTSKQIKQILAEDGTEQLIRIDPSADVAYAEERDTSEDKTWIVFNPKVGRFWVDSDVGPSYATKRQEAWNAFVQITTANQELVTVIGDLMFRNADFPGAEEIAERLKRMVPPEVKEDGIDPALQKAQEQNAALQGLLAEMTEKLAMQELKLKDNERQNDIRQQEADTKRLKELGNAESDLSEETLRPIIEKLLKDIMTNEDRQGEKEAELDKPTEGLEDEPKWAADPVVAPQGPEALGGTSGAQDEVSQTAQPPVEGARQATDGQWYVQDPTRPGKWARVDAQ